MTHVRAGRIAAMVVACLAGCPAPRAVKPAAGEYDAVPPEARVIFAIGRDGMLHFPGQDIDCRSSLRGTRLALDCHGHTISARWIEAADGSVSTDLLDVIVGAHDPGMRTYRARAND